MNIGCPLGLVVHESHADRETCADTSQGFAVEGSFITFIPNHLQRAFSCNLCGSLKYSRGPDSPENRRGRAEILPSLAVVLVSYYSPL